MLQALLRLVRDGRFAPAVMSNLSSARGLCSCTLTAMQVLDPFKAADGCLEDNTAPPRSVCSIPRQQCVYDISRCRTLILRLDNMVGLVMPVLGEP